EELDEHSDPGTGPLAEIVRDWEAACEPARRAGARVVAVRTGIVLSGAGGMLPALAAVTRTGLGGRLGSGRQWMAWIARDDLTDIYLRAATDDAVSGTGAAVAPHSALNSHFPHRLGSVLPRPTVVPVPACAPGLLLGQRGGHELAIADQLVRPRALGDAAHVFRYPRVSDALAHEL